MKNYKLSDETKTTPLGTVLHRIVATTTFTLACGLTVDVGDVGGWIEKESNLSDDAWVYGDARVSGNAEVSGDARVYGDALVSGNAEVSGNAQVVNVGDYIVFKNSWSSGRYFTWTKSNDKWDVGCFYGTGDELIKKAYADSEYSGKHYEAYVKLVETLKNME